MEKDARGDRVSTGVGVLDRSMAILHAFPNGETALQPKELASRCGMTLSTAYRFINALAEHELLERSGSGYRLGIGLLRLGNRMAEGIEIRRQVRPHLEWLNARTEENAALHVRRGSARVSVELVKGLHFVRPLAEAEVGEPRPLHLGASGKALLAWLDAEEAMGLARESAERFGGEWDEGSFAEQLAATRRKGWIDSESEWAESVASVSAPIFDAGGVAVASVVVSALFLRLPKSQREGIAPMVMEAASRASRSIGYEGGPSRTGQAADA